VQNLGTTNRNVDLEIENKELGIKSTGSLTIEKFGDDDTKKEVFMVTLPRTAAAGEYIIKAKLGLSTKTLTSEKKLLLGACKYIVKEETPTEPIIIKGEAAPITEPKKSFFEDAGIPTYAIGIFIFIALFGVIVLFIFLLKNPATVKVTGGRKRT